MEPVDNDTEVAEPETPDTGGKPASPPQDNVTKLWQAASAHFTNLGTLDQFRQKMADPGNQQKFWQAASKTFDNLGTLDQFRSKIAANQSVTPTSAPSVPRGTPAPTPDNVTNPLTGAPSPKSSPSAAGLPAETTADEDAESAAFNKATTAGAFGLPNSPSDQYADQFAGASRRLSTLVNSPVGDKSIDHLMDASYQASVHNALRDLDASEKQISPMFVPGSTVLRTPDEIKTDRDNYKATIQQNADAQVAVLKHIKQSNPDLSQGIDRDMLLLNMKDLADRSPERIPEILQRADELDAGQLKYPGFQRLVKNGDFFSNVSDALIDHDRKLADFDNMANWSDDQALAEYKKRQSEFDPLTPQPDLSSIGGQVGENLRPLSKAFAGAGVVAAGAMIAAGTGGAALPAETAVGTGGLATWVGSLFAGHDYFKTQYTAKYWQTLDDQIKAETEPYKALAIARSDAKYSATTTYAAMALMTGVGMKVATGEAGAAEEAFDGLPKMAATKQTGLPLAQSPYFGPYANRVGGALINHLGKSALETGGVTAVASAQKISDNIHEGKPPMQDVDQTALGMLRFMRGATMLGTIATLGKQLLAGSPTPYSQAGANILASGAARMPAAITDQHIASGVAGGAMSFDEAKAIGDHLSTIREVESAYGKPIPQQNLQKVLLLHSVAKQLQGQLDSKNPTYADPSLHAAIKEQLHGAVSMHRTGNLTGFDGLHAQIGKLMDEPEQAPANPNSPFTVNISPAVTRSLQPGDSPEIVRGKLQMQAAARATLAGNLPEATRIHNQILDEGEANLKERFAQIPGAHIDIRRTMGNYGQHTEPSFEVHLTADDAASHKAAFDALADFANEHGQDEFHAHQILSGDHSAEIGHANPDGSTTEPGLRAHYDEPLTDEQFHAESEDLKKIGFSGATLSPDRKSIYLYNVSKYKNAQDFKTLSDDNTRGILPDGPMVSSEFRKTWVGSRQETGRYMGLPGAEEGSGAVSAGTAAAGEGSAAATAEEAGVRSPVPELPGQPAQEAGSGGSAAAATPINPTEDAIREPGPGTVGPHDQRDGSPGGPSQGQGVGPGHEGPETPQEGQKEGPQKITDDLPFGQSVGIAHDTRAYRAATTGQIAPIRGQGRTPEEMIEHGRQMLSHGADPQKAADDFARTGAITEDSMSLVWAENERLAKETNAAGDKFGQDSPQYKAASKAETDWYNGTVKPMQTVWSNIGEAQQGKTDMEYGSFTGVRRAFESQTGAKATEAESATAKDMAAKVAALEKERDDLAAKVKDLSKAAPEKTKAAKTYAEKAKALADWFRQLKTKPFTFKDENGNDVPINKMGLDWNDVVEFGAKVIEKTGEVADGIKAVVDQIKDQGWYKGLSDSDKTAFEKQLAAHYQEDAPEATPEEKNIARLEKQLEDLRQGKVKQIGPKRELSQKEKDLQDQIFEAKKNLGLIKSKPTQEEASGKIGPDEYQDMVTRFSGKKDNDFSTEDSQQLWQYARENYIDNNPNFNIAQMVVKVSMDMGLTPDQVRQALGRIPDGKSVLDQAWKNQYELTKARTTIRNWIASKSQNGATKFINAVAAPFRSLATLGHGHALLFTHAANNLFDVGLTKKFLTLAGKQFKIVYGDEATYQKAVNDLRSDPLFTTALRAGVAVDPNTVYDDWQLPSTWLKKLQVQGNKGFLILKMIRMEVFRHMYDQLSNIEKADPETVKRTGDIANHWTGNAGIKVSPAANAFIFAPNLIVSKFARLTTDPLNALHTTYKIMRGQDVSLADRAASRIILRKTGRVMAGYLGALAANQAMLKLTGSSASVNFTHPTRSDWLKFQTGDALGDRTVDASGGMIRAMQLLTQLAIMPFEKKGDYEKDFYGSNSAQDATRKVLTDYGTSILSPFGSTAYELATHKDYRGNVLPWSSDKPAHGKEKLTYWGYARQKLPIPVAEALQEVHDEMTRSGVPKPTADQVIGGIVAGAVGSAGIRVGNPPPKGREAAGSGAGARGSWGRK